MSQTQDPEPNPEACDPFAVQLFGWHFAVQNAVDVRRLIRGVGFLLIVSAVIGYAAGAMQLPERESGEITVNTNPPGATIFVDGVHRGSTPLKVTRLSPGTHQLKAVMPGYKGVVLQLEVMPSRKEKLDWMLEPSVPPTVHKQLARAELPTGQERS